MGPIENPVRKDIRLVRRLMKQFVQYRDYEWFRLREELDELYDQLPAKEKAR